jgi:hypothetical protein
MTKIFCRDNRSFYSINRERKIRFVKMPEDRAFLVGQLSVNGKSILLYKSEQHHNVAVPEELFQNLPNVQNWLVKHLSSTNLLSANRKSIDIFGYRPNILKAQVQSYILVDRNVWSCTNDAERKRDYEAH